ncbi:MAG: hypothetical protein JNJ54_06335 [Myxococcaceae bacterium]|nr:hypothetical protein [Myxococcaceae bacterium]
MESPLPDDVADTVARCVEAMGDLDRLRDELHQLRLSSDPRAQFATALFDLDRARRGDPEARNELIDVADRLLVFWHEGSGVEFAKMHPELEELWASAASLLVSFEQKRFKKALAECWENRSNPTLLQEAIENLEPAGNRRVEFARCLYHLELARQFVESSRGEFARRAGLLSEAYQSDEVAKELVADDQGLEHLWSDLRPYLDEFFEMMEEQAAKRARAAALAAAEAEIASQRTPPAGVPELARDFQPTDPIVPVTAPPDTIEPELIVELAESPAVPSFRSLMQRAPSGAVPPPPPDTTPPGSWFPPPGVTPPADHEGPPAGQTTEPTDEVDIIEALEAPPPPPAPPDLTPPGQWVPGADGDIEIVEAEEGPPPPPPTTTPAHGVPPPPPKARRQLLDIVLDEDDPDQATMAFWQFANKTLDLLPDPRQPRPPMRLLNVDTRGDRKKLTEYLEAAEPYARQNADARAFSCLIRLMLAGQLKEKSLFGQPNARRAEAFMEAFALLSGDARAAGHGTVWFVMDGPETLTTLHRGLEVLTTYVSWCSREKRDPLDRAAQAEFLGGLTT